MSLGAGIVQSQAINLTLNADLRQGVHILQYSVSELLAYIDDQLCENPFLEVTKEGSYRRSSPLLGTRSDRGPLELLSRPEESLESALREQLHCMPSIPANIRRISEFIIGNLNDSGYLTISPAEIVRSLGAAPHEVEEALALIRSFDPVGIAASTVKECLLLQLRERFPDHALAEKLIEGYLQELAGGSRVKIAHKLRVSLRDIEDALAVIRELNPRPGLAYGRERIGYIVPDLMVRRTDRGFEVVVHEGVLPRLAVSREYSALLRQRQRQGTDRERTYLQEGLRSASWLIRCIAQRSLTLRKVAEAMAARQQAFIEEGPGRLVPMTMKEIALQVGLHESTVSRAVSGKYIRLPWGVRELKTLFSHAASDRDGVSQDAVKARIREWIRGENRDKPYSDQQLAERLAEEGVRVSRRTIAKYRDELGIFSSSQRQALRG